MLDIQVRKDEDLRKIEEALEAVVKLSQTTNAMIITQDGQHIMSAGDVSFINTTALAALVAGMFSATREVARLLGEVEFSILFQQGQKRNIHISLINQDVMLLVVFEGVEKTGIVRMKTAQYGKEISKYLKPSASGKAAANTAVPQPVEALANPTGAVPAGEPVLPGDGTASGKPAKELSDGESSDSKITEQGFDAFKEYATSLLDDIFTEG